MKLSAVSSHVLVSPVRHQTRSNPQDYAYLVFTRAGSQPVAKLPTLEGQGFYSGFPFLRLPTMANVPCLTAT
jgi:hypothetical protein